jgi:hypothetical protein
MGQLGLKFFHNTDNKAVYGYLRLPQRVEISVVKISEDDFMNDDYMRKLGFDIPVRQFKAGEWVTNKYEISPDKTFKIAKLDDGIVYEVNGQPHRTEDLRLARKGEILKAWSEEWMKEKKIKVGDEVEVDFDGKKIKGKLAKFHLVDKNCGLLWVWNKHKYWFENNPNEKYLLVLQINNSLKSDVTSYNIDVTFDTPIRKVDEQEKKSKSIDKNELQKLVDFAELYDALKKRTKYGDIVRVKGRDSEMKVYFEEGEPTPPFDVNRLRLQEIYNEIELGGRIRKIKKGKNKLTVYFLKEGEPQWATGSDFMHKPFDENLSMHEICEILGNTNNQDNSISKHISITHGNIAVSFTEGGLTIKTK